MEFAADLPTPVVAETLGIHIETAVRWSKYAKRDWTAYVAARIEGAKSNEPARANAREAPAQSG